MAGADKIIIDTQLLDTGYECENDKEGFECGRQSAWCVTAFDPEATYSTYVCIECAEEIYGGIEAFAQMWADSIGIPVTHRIDRL